MTSFIKWALFLVFLAVQAEAAVSPPQTNTLRVRALGEPQTLDWNLASTWVEGFIIRNLMDGLVGVDSNLKPVPALAKSWEISRDLKTYTFFLRSDVKWSDGSALKAEDFLMSWKRLLDPATGAKYCSILFDVEGAEAFHKGESKDFSHVGFKALDDLTIQVKLRAPIPYWHWITTFYATYPLKKGNPTLSLGAYYLKSYEPGRQILLEKNPYYYGTRGNIDSIAVALVKDDSTALKLYDEGQIDFLAKIPSLALKRSKGRKDLKTWADLRTVHMRFNTRQNPTANPILRKAIAMSIDRSQLKRIFEGSYIPATSFVPPGILSYSKSAGVNFDPEKAKAELKAAGIDPIKLPPLDLLTVGFDDQIILGQFIQEELKRNLNLTIKLHILEPKRYYSPSLNHNDYAMQINFWGADFPDPDNFYSIFLSESGLNRYAWKNETYDKVVTSARSISDRKNREKAYFSAQKLLLEDQVVTVPLYYGNISGLVRDNIQGFHPGPLNWWAFKDLSLK